MKYMLMMSLLAPALLAGCNLEKKRGGSLQGAAYHRRL